MQCVGDKEDYLCVVVLLLSVLAQCKVIPCVQYPDAPFCGAVAHSSWDPLGFIYLFSILFFFFL